MNDLEEMTDERMEIELQGMTTDDFVQVLLEMIKDQDVEDDEAFYLNDPMDETQDYDARQRVQAQ